MPIYQGFIVNEFYHVIKVSLNRSVQKSISKKLLPPKRSSYRFIEGTGMALRGLRTCKKVFRGNKVRIKK